jgi:hypothetical protein
MAEPVTGEPGLASGAPVPTGGRIASASGPLAVVPSLGFDCAPLFDPSSPGAARRRCERAVASRVGWRPRGGTLTPRDDNVAPGHGMYEQRSTCAAPLADLSFDEVGVGRWLVAPGGSGVRANEERLRSSDYTAEQVVGEDFIEVCPETRGARDARSRTRGSAHASRTAP